MLTGYASTAARKFLALTLPPLRVSPEVRSLLLAAATILAVMATAIAIVWLPLQAAVLLVFGAIFLTLLLIEPTVGLYALIVIIPFSTPLALPMGGAKVGLMEIVLVLTVSVGLLKILVSQSISGRPFKIKTEPLAVPFLIMITGVALSWLNTLSIGASLVETAKWIEMFVLYLFIINFLPPKHIKWAVLAIILAGTAQALLGLYQFIFKAGPEGFLLFSGRFLRAYGTFAQPNPYAGYLGLVLPLVLSLTIWIIFESRGSFSLYIPHQANPVTQLGRKLSQLFSQVLKLALFLLPLGLMLAALFASQSRGAMVGFAAAAVATVIVRSKKMVMLFLTTVVIVAFIALLSSFSLNITQSDDYDEANSPYQVVTQRLADAITIVTITDIATTPVTDANFAALERLAHWQAGREMWRDNLWLGVGFGNYAVIYPAYAVGRWQDPLGHAHNYLLNIGAEAGLVGLTVYLIFWILIFGLLWIIVQHTGGFYKAVAAGAIGILVHLHIHNLVDNLYVQGMYLHIAVILGLVSVIYLNMDKFQTKYGDN